MNHLHCPDCGRFLADYGSTGHSNGVRDWDVNWGVCSKHGYVEWES